MPCSLTVLECFHLLHIFFLSLTHSFHLVFICACAHLGPWDIQIDLKHINQTKGDNNKVELGIDLREFYPSVEWDILGK